MRIAKVLKKPGLVLLVLIIATEIIFRLTVAYKLQKWSPCQYQPDPVLGFRYKPNSTGSVYDAALTRPYKINSQGFAGAEFATKKAKGIYRISVVGASDETGLYTNGPLNYINVAEGLFKKNGYKVEMLNLAIDGHGRTMRNVEFLKTTCAEYEPDLVLYALLEFPVEDYREFRTTYKGVVIKYTDTSQGNLDAAKAYIDHELSHKSFLLYLYDYSYIYRWMVKTYLSKYQKEKSKTWQRFGEFLFESANKMECYARHVIFWPRYNYRPTVYSEEGSVQVFKHLQEELSKRNTKLIILNTYAIDDAAFKKQLFAKNQLTYLPLQVFRKDEFSFGELNGHSSQEGQKAVGTSLFNALKDSIPAHALLLQPSRPLSCRR